MSAVVTNQSEALIETSLTGQRLLDNPLLNKSSAFSRDERREFGLKVGQCNNVFIFPGVGLGVIASGADRVTDAMFSVAARVLSEFSPALTDTDAPLYPPLESVREISRKVAVAVGVEAQQAGAGRNDWPRRVGAKRER
jgi:malic enzyme